MIGRDSLLVLGCQRSGTTLLRLMLEVHPEVACADEALAYRVLAGKQREGDETRRTYVAFKIPRFTEQLLEPDVRDELYGTLAQFYDRQRAVFVVRDPRDVVASMLSLRTSTGRSWIETYGRRMIEHRTRERAGFADRYAAELDQLARRGWPDHLMASMYWTIKNDALPTYVDAGLPILPVRYERLVAAPEPALRRILAHLGVPWHPAVLRHHELPHGQLEADGRTIGGSDPSRAIDERSVGRHASELSASELRDVEEWTAASAALAGDVLGRLNA